MAIFHADGEKCQFCKLSMSANMNKKTEYGNGEYVTETKPDKQQPKAISGSSTQR